MTKSGLFFCVVWLALIVGWTGCVRQADVTAPVRFKEGALVFDYPGNWRVTMNEALGEGRLVMLEEPGSALVTITAYPPGVQVSLKDYGENIRQDMSGSELGNLMSIKSRTTRQTDDALELAFTVTVAGVQVPHTQTVTRHVFGDVTVFCMSQVADEDRHLVLPGFELVRGSLRMEGAAGGS